MSGAVAGLILAGGLGRRLGGLDKAMVTLAGRRLIERVVARLAPQCTPLLINANGDADRFAAFGLPVVPDGIAGHPGPLAGILAGLDWLAEHRPDAAMVASTSVDTPFLPRDLIEGLCRARCEAGTALASAVSAGRRHHVVTLWPTRIRHELRQTLAGRGERSVGTFLADHGVAEAHWPAEPFDPFFNINRPEDIAAAGRILAGDPSA